MNLTISTPMAVVAEIAEVAHVRAEDATGAFGILAGHADFLTVLTVSVVSWRLSGGLEGHCAVRGGVFSVTGGSHVAIATSDAVAGDDLARLEREVLARFAAEDEALRRARTEAVRLQAAAVRRVLAYLRPDRPRHSLGPEGGGP